MNEENLVFIISQPRSGSTLLQTILANHPKVDTTSEHWMLLPFLSVFKPAISQAVYDQDLASDAFIDFLSKYCIEDAFKEGLKEVFLKTYSKMLNNNHNFIIDKTPRYYEIFDLIYTLFPKAKFIILKRNPLAVISSIVKTWNRNSFKSLAKYHHRDLFVGPYKIFEIEKNYALNQNVKILRFEDFLENTQIILDELFEWLGIDTLENFSKYTIPDSIKGKYGDPTGIYKSSGFVKNKGINSTWKMGKGNQHDHWYLQGYGAFLGKNFLNEYGYTWTHSERIPVKFRLFMHYSFQDNFISFLPAIKGMMGYYWSKLFFKEDI